PVEPPAKEKHRGTYNRVNFERSEIEKLQIVDLPDMSVEIFHWEEKPVLMLWCDSVAGGGAGHSFVGGTGPTMKYRSGFSYDRPKARHWYYDVEIHNAEQAQLTFALQGADKGQGWLADPPRYDLSNGSCFLVSGMRGGLRVKQMKV